MRIATAALVLLLLTPPAFAGEGEAELSRAREQDRQIGRLREAGKFAEAEKLAKGMLAIRESALPPNHPLIGRSLLTLAALQIRLGKAGEARPLFERGFAIYQKAMQPETPPILVAMLRAAGNFEGARVLYEGGLRRRSKTLGQQVYTLWKAEEYGKAEVLARKDLALTEALSGPDSRNVAVCLLNVGAQLKGQGRYREAIGFYERSLATRERLVEPDDEGTAESLNELALVLMTCGRYDAARPHIERALALRVKVLGPEHPAVATSLGNLAWLLQETGQYAAAEPLILRSLAIREKAYGRDHAAVSNSLHDLGYLFRRMKRYEEALPLYERSIAISEEVYGPDHPEVATTVSNLASLLLAMGRPKDARPHYERALRIRERALGSEHPDLATSLNNLAYLHRRTRRYEEARPLYERALAILEETRGPEHLETANSLNNLAVLLRCLGEGKDAVPLHTRCLDIVELNLRRRFLALEPSDRHGALIAGRGYLAAWLWLAPEVGRSGYEEVLRFKGLVARTTAAESRLLRRSGAVAESRIAPLRAAERELARLAGSMPTVRQKAKHRAWRESYAAAAAERNRLARDLSRELAPLSAGLERLDIDLAEIRARLSPHEALVDYLRSGERYLAWIVRRDGPVEVLDLGKAQGIEVAAAKFPVDGGQAARDLVIAPVTARLGKDVTTLILCPDAALAAVPYAALPGREKGRYLIDDFRLRYVSMSQDLVPWKEERRTGKGALLIGGVDYGKPSRGVLFCRLPETRTEVARIEKLLGENCEILDGAGATESAIRSGAAGRSVLHLATHGFARRDSRRGLRPRKNGQTWLGAEREIALAAGHDPMLLAGLALAMANERDDGSGGDGILTAAEVSSMDLDCVRLVVLSACETALGKAESGNGVIGLVRGFQMAGAKRVIASLWQVDDAATRALMCRFYEIRKPGGTNDAEALWTAQAHVRSHEKWRHPRYWAAWMLWGGAR